MYIQNLTFELGEKKIKKNCDYPFKIVIIYIRIIFITNFLTIRSIFDLLYRFYRLLSIFTQKDF